MLQQGAQLCSQTFGERLKVSHRMEIVMGARLHFAITVVVLKKKADPLLYFVVSKTEVECKTQGGEEKRKGTLCLHAGAWL